MKLLFTLFFCCSLNLLFAQDELKIFNTNKEGGGYVIFASNVAFCPVSITLDLDITNLNFIPGEQKVFVVPAKTDSFKLGELNIATPGKKYKFSYRYTYILGDITLKNYDETFEYNLPFPTGKSFTLFQGYDGKFSHQNENALDFTMPEGTDVLAAREGIVIKVVQSNTESCEKQECMKYNNYITIYHPDGTQAVYAHIKYNGSKVKVGDHVSTGQLIGLSGNTGWSSGPHLHFACYFKGQEKGNSIATKFKIKNGSPAEYLVEKVKYMKEY